MKPQATGGKGKQRPEQQAPAQKAQEKKKK